MGPGGTPSPPSEGAWLPRSLLEPTPLPKLKPFVLPERCSPANMINAVTDNGMSTCTAIKNLTELVCHSMRIKMIVIHGTPVHVHLQQCCLCKGG